MPAAVTTNNAPVDIAIPFIRSVREVFKTMLSLDLATGKPYLKTNVECAHYVSGVIGFSGVYNGSVVVSFPRGAAKAVVEKFTGTEIDDSTTDFSDAVGEITNIIVGSAKSSLGTATTISVPSVIIGPGHKVARLSGVPCIVIPCSCQAGEFCIEICIQQSSSQAGSN